MQTVTANRSYEGPTPVAQTHWQRCKTLPPIQRGEAERLIAEFLSTRGVTACPARYLAPIEQRPLLVQSR